MMKKNNLVIGFIYVIFGMLCLLISLYINTKLDSLLFGFFCSFNVVGIIIIGKYYYWNSPKNIEGYKEKLENERIELQDELKDKIRCKTAQYVYMVGLITISISILIFSILSKLEIIENGTIFTLYLCGYMFLQIISGRLIYNHISKKFK